MDGWAEIFSTHSLPIAKLKKDRLELENIAVILLNQQDSLYNNFGSIKLYVRPEHVIKAKHLLSKFHE